VQLISHASISLVNTYKQHMINLSVVNAVR